LHPLPLSILGLQVLSACRYIGESALREAQGLPVKGLVAYAMRIGLMEVIILWFELWSIYYGDVG